MAETKGTSTGNIVDIAIIETVKTVDMVLNEVFGGSSNSSSSSSSNGGNKK